MLYAFGIPVVGTVLALILFMFLLVTVTTFQSTETTLATFRQLELSNTDSVDSVSAVSFIAYWTANLHIFLIFWRTNIIKTYDILMRAFIRPGINVGGIGKSSLTEEVRNLTDYENKILPLFEDPMNSVLNQSDYERILNDETTTADGLEKNPENSALLAKSSTTNTSTSKFKPENVYILAVADPATGVGLSPNINAFECFANKNGYTFERSMSFIDYQQKEVSLSNGERFDISKCAWHNIVFFFKSCVVAEFTRHKFEKSAEPFAVFVMDADTVPRSAVLEPGSAFVPVKKKKNVMTEATEILSDYFDIPEELANGGATKKEPSPKAIFPTLDPWLNLLKDSDLVFYERRYTGEIAAGNYILRGTFEAISFLRNWASRELTQPTGYASFDQSALELEILRSFGRESAYKDCKKEFADKVTIYSDWREGMVMKIFPLYIHDQNFFIPTHCTREELGLGKLTDGFLKGTTLVMEYDDYLSYRERKKLKESSDPYSQFWEFQRTRNNTIFL